MNLTATRITTQARTWALIAALSALIVVVGGQFLGGGGYLVAALFAVAFNGAMYWFSAPPRAARQQGAAGRRDRLPPLHGSCVSSPRGPACPSRSSTSSRPSSRTPSRPVATPARGGRRDRGAAPHMPIDQVRGVLAHEFAHIKNRDILVSSIAAMRSALITGIAYALQFGHALRRRATRTTARSASSARSR